VSDHSRFVLRNTKHQSENKTQVYMTTTSALQGAAWIHRKKPRPIPRESRKGEKITRMSLSTSLRRDLGAVGPRHLYWPFLESQRPSFLKISLAFLPPALDLLEVRLGPSKPAELAEAVTGSALARSLADLRAFSPHLCLMKPAFRSSHHQSQV